jgi:hypothetical protein
MLVLLVLLVSLGHLCVLFLYFIDFGDINECDMFLSVNFLKFKTLIDSCIADHIDFLFDKWKFNCQFLWTTLLHYLYNYLETITVL